MIFFILLKICCEFTKTRFMAQGVIYSGEGSCALEKKVKLIVLG